MTCSTSWATREWQNQMNYAEYTPRDLSYPPRAPQEYWRPKCSNDNHVPTPTDERKEPQTEHPQPKGKSSRGLPSQHEPTVAQVCRRLGNCPTSSKKVNPATSRMMELNHTFRICHLCSEFTGNKYTTLEDNVKPKSLIYSLEGS